jgi:two-component system sensor histidine kinase DesK
MWAAVTPWTTQRTRIVLVLASVTAVVLLWWPLTTWAEAGEAPWSWLAGVAAGSVALTVPWRAGVAVAVSLGSGTAVAARVRDEPLLSHLVPFGGAAALVLIVMLAMVWLLRLLVAAEHARRTESRAILLEERLRVAREIHDAVGHQMAVIALKAEVAGRFAGSDVARTRAEMEAIRELTRNTLLEVRRAVHGDTVADIDTQLQTAAAVLTSAGIDVDIAARAFPVTRPESQLLAAVVREAVTNILRHADASRVAIAFPQSVDRREMVISNDVRAVAGSDDDRRGGTGLDGLSARCAELGARLEVRQHRGTFCLTVQLPSQPALGG